MNISLIAFLDFALLSVSCAIAIAVYLMPRRIAPAAAWYFSLAVAVLLSLAATFLLRSLLGGVVPTMSLLKSYGALCLIPTCLLTAAAVFLRSRLHSRAVGVAILVALFWMSSTVARRVSAVFFDLVNASG